MIVRAIDGRYLGHPFLFSIEKERPWQRLSPASKFTIVLERRSLAVGWSVPKKAKPEASAAPEAMPKAEAAPKRGGKREPKNPWPDRAKASKKKCKT